MRIALLFNQKPEAPPAPDGTPDDLFEEYDSIETVNDIADALRGLGAEVEPVAAGRDLPARLEHGHYDFAFNMAEGPLTLAGRARRCREALAPSVCELLGLPYTGSDPLTLALTLDKALARRVVSPDVPVAPAVLVEDPPAEDQFAHLRFPVIVKPNDEGSSKGIRADSVAIDPAAAVERARRLADDYRCSALVEEFLPGPEVTVAVAGNPPDLRVLGMMEIAPVCDGQPFVYSLEMKRGFRTRVKYHAPPRLASPALERLRRAALSAYRLLGCRDIARIDFRLDAQGRPCFLECNPLPGLNRASGDIVILTRESIAYEKLVQGILIDAARRTGVKLA